MKRILFLVLLMCCSITQIRAQQDPMFSQYMFNGLFVNPGYAGTHDFISGTLTFRNQWLSIPGAPKTFLLAADAPIKFQPMGVGFIASNDQIGFLGATDLFGVYSYRVKTSRKSALSFGIRAGIVNFRENNQDAIINDKEDPVLDVPNLSAWYPKVGLGIYYYKEDEYYVGLSAPTLLSYDADRFYSFDMDVSSFFKRHYYLTGGYIFVANEYLKLKPFTLIKYMPRAPLQVDLNMSAIVYDSYGFGVGARIDKNRVGLSLIGEVQINNMFRAGFAYNFEFGEMRRYFGGTTEILLGIDLGKSNMKKIRSIRSF